MTLFEQTETYKNILDRGYSDNITVAYHISTDIVVNSETVDSLIKEEIVVYDAKLDEVRKLVPDFQIPTHLHAEIEHRIRAFMGSTYCIVEYASFNTNEMLDVVREIESKDGFKEWLVK
jgi:hypothetical protein